MNSFLIWENDHGRNYLHGLYYGNSIEEALDNLAREKQYKDGATLKCFPNRQEWFAAKKTDLSKFRFEEVT